jgi:flagellar hook assembly protein FlgD
VGRWALTVATTDDQGLTSSTTTRLSVNTTLASLRLAPARMVVRTAGGRAAIRWAQARPARVRVTIESRDGGVVRTVANAPLGAGDQAVVWDGRARTRKPVAGGRYVVRVTARNAIGTVSLTRVLTVRRAKA